MVALLAIDSFTFPFSHKIIGGLDVQLYLIEIYHFVFFTEKEKRNYPEKYSLSAQSLSSTQESRDFTQSIWIVFVSLFNFHCERKKREY